MYPRESNNIEWKETTKSNFLKTVCAFANYGDGEIIFGITDGDGDIIGIENAEKEKLSIENSINDNITPRPNFTLKIEKLNEIEVIILKIFKGSKPPYMYKNKTFQRQDTATVPVDEVAFQMLFMEGANLSFDELEAKTDNLTFNRLEQELKNTLGINSLTTDLLKTMGLHNTNAGMLLADTNNYKYGVDIVRFGANDNIFVERKEIKGVSLLEQYLETMAMFDKWYSPYEEIVGFYRETRLQIPREAFREAVANALIHRNYVLKSNIRIAMREDSIEIISPGGLPTGISKDAYEKGLYSQIRNETIAETFRRLQIVEKYGTGIKRIRESYQIYKQIPKFDLIDGLATQVILPKITYVSTNDKPDYESQVLDYINTHVEATRAEIKQAIGGSDATLKRVLLKLTLEDKIRKVGNSRATKYQSIL